MMKRGDWIVISVILFIAAALLMVNEWRGSSEDALSVEVRIDGELVDTFSLDELVDKVYETQYGYNRLTIIEGAASVVEADCHDHICVDTKAAAEKGDAIVCVPNRFTVEVIGEGGEVDAIAR